MNSSSKSDFANILGLPISLKTHAAVLALLEKRIAAKDYGGYISITNTESMYHALRRPSHREFIVNADLSLCDGVGVIIAGLFWGGGIRRYNGPILQLDASKYGESLNWRHFFYGGKEGVADLMASKLKEQFPRLNIVGTYCPPFRQMTAEEDELVVAQINDTKPDIVWVGLGLIKQEAWIAAHLGKIRAPWMVGVGAAFDYHSGAVPWAPRWIRSLGLEWLFRLIIQPKIRGKRYWWSLVFVVEAVISGIFQKKRI